MPRLKPLAGKWAGIFVALLGGAAVVGACDPEGPASATETIEPDDTKAIGDDLRAYVGDFKIARAALEASLVTRENGYARRRLERYTETTWGSLPAYDPRSAPMLVEPTTRSAVPAPDPSDPAWSRTLVDPDTFEPTDAALRALGERAFFQYPVQPAPGLPEALDQPDQAGVWTNEGKFGVVWTETSVGVRGAFTCATCHATPAPDGKLFVGLNNPRIDAAKLSANPEALGWGLGRVDVTSDGAANPAVITDLRPIRWQRRYHRAATLYAGTQALAVRIETLIITNNSEAIRPPKLIAAGLTMFLLSLGTSTPRSEVAPTSAGAAVFDRTCARCHTGEGAAGSAVSLEEIGTNPAVGLSSDRGTGGYRVPSLRGAAVRRPLFSDGAVSDLEALLDPQRTVPGHPHGLSLSAPDRAALLAYLALL